MAVHMQSLVVTYFVSSIPTECLGIELLVPGNFATYCFVSLACADALKTAYHMTSLLFSGKCRVIKIV